MSNIRLLEESEVPLLIPGASSFFNEGGLSGTLNENAFINSLQSYIRSGVGYVLVDDDLLDFNGAIGGICHPDFATGVNRCTELFWYVKPDQRGSLGVRLLQAFEIEAQKRGADRVIMMHLCRGQESKFTRFYERRGYHMTEQVFEKPLTKEMN